MTTKSIKVKIFGAEYPLRGDNEDFTRRVAENVDRMLMKIHEKIPEQPPLTVAVLSALNITEDLLKEQARHHDNMMLVESEVTKLSNYLDNLLLPGDEQLL
ncbi:MAG: hypothetical protein A2X67_12465 [Ignavibacteria bacterium GWA2_55_11]|nr:MAG: hypothetical protein A2X67_12465 [Ignavibacteria bacterium GWA2_55_11]OGU44052.1 MAG: hypothetical protein A2X68_05350 [Ignavibacteria bacterium GWC2_56_12]OGU68353.1 MAG: hypothetical protein A3C56_08950 [Ignavibacteria bacterium RIFCSPHIGHO2_02_FULL_56_12]OGU71307.1 MAG: hypothetical protein A3G43_13540 [Ignavibacteria bacterium RIFCSPLOWO2_12_FULL_56_21]OGU75592.1 MAG: hypothetical protein A3H45_11465 [Ignavibacteria bacterium RIFCSPLOWO2_02_FULL_55_14]HAV24099.1 hypothetical protei